MALLGAWVVSAPPGACALFPPGEISSFSRDLSGVVRLTIRDPFLGSTAVETSTDLRDWVGLGTISLATGEAIFSDPASPPGASFYRLAPPALDYSGDPMVSFEDPCLTVPEETPFVSLTVTRRGPLDAPLEVPWHLVADGATVGQDYVADPGVAQFPAGADQTTIPVELIDNPETESDEAFFVVLSPPPAATAWPHASARVTIADNESPVRTVVACAGLQSPYWSTPFGPSSLESLDGRIYWSAPSERRLLSWEPGERAPRTEAPSFGIPLAVTVAGPYLIRLEASGGINALCTGFGVIGDLVRTARDGGERLALARLNLCSGSFTPPVASDEGVYYVDSEGSPDRYYLRRVPINGGSPQTLLTLDFPIRSLLVAGPYIWCTEDDFGNPDTDRDSVLWRVAIDGSGAEEWVTGLQAPRGRLLRDERFLYLADNSFGGQERLLRISPADRSVQILWETDDYFNRNDFLDLVLASGHLFWLNEDSLQVLPTTGGTPRTLVENIELPGHLSTGPGWVAWSEGYRAGRLRKYDLSSDLVSVLADPVRRPGPLVHADGTLWFTVGTRDYLDEGDAEIRALNLGDGSNVAVAGGFTMQRPPITSGGGQLHAVDQWTIKRLTGNSQPPVIVHFDSFHVSTLAADEDSVYWVGEPLGTIRAIDFDGEEPRTVVSAGGRPIGLQVEGSRLFWIDDPSLLRSVPVTGGTPTDLITGAGAISTFVTDSTHIFAAMQDAGQLVRLPHAGGTPTVLATFPRSSVPNLAQTGTHLLWSTSNGVRAVPKLGGATLPVIEGLPESPAALATDGTQLYWLETGADRIRTVPFSP
jgi:hypothetical protein